MKKYIKYSLVFLILGIACGIFYREFSKAYDVTGTFTTLGLVHPHFLTLGVLFILIIGLVTEKLKKSEGKLLKAALGVYATGVLGTGIMLFVRGILDVLTKSPSVDFAVSSGASGAISGVAGIFHAILGVGLILIFVVWLSKGKAPAAETTAIETPAEEIAATDSATADTIAEEAPAEENA